MTKELTTEEKTRKLLTFIAEKFEADEIDNNSLVQIIELCGNYLNLKTISDYADFKKMSYNGAKKSKQIREMFGTKFVIDND